MKYVTMCVINDSITCHCSYKYIATVAKCFPALINPRLISGISKWLICFNEVKIHTDKSVLALCATL